MGCEPAEDIYIYIYNAHNNVTCWTYYLLLFIIKLYTK